MRLQSADRVDDGGKWSSVGDRGAAGAPADAHEHQASREEGAVFLGTHTPRLDDKGRLFLPAKFRDQLAEGVVITKGQERCLFVFTAPTSPPRPRVPAATPDDQGRARLQPHVLRQRLRRGPRQAGPRHRPGRRCAPTPG